MIVIPRASRATLLAILLNKDAPEELDLHIYKNDITPDDDTAIGDFTEADFLGYAVEELDSAAYAITTPSAGSNEPASADYGDVEFASSADQASNDNYGYFVTRRTTGDLLWCERFTDGPYAIASLQHRFYVNPRFSVGEIE